MRVTLVLAVALAAASGCRTRPLDQPISDDGSFSPSDGGANDFARGFDFALTPDLSRLGCAALARCVAQCGGGDQNCFNNCQMAASNRARNQFDNALQCGETWCLGMNGGARRCVIDPSGQMFVDAPNVPPGDCNVCLQNVFAQLFGGMCFPTNDSACMPQACLTPYEVCLNN